ncbi:MAG: T9SS type A sorting domain-containing protein, partial [Tunicatimonas sp.]
TKLDWFSLESNQLAGGELEAESASLQSGFSPLETGNDNNASGGQFIHAPGRDSRSMPPASGRASYNFNLPASGDATLTARVLAPNTGANSFWYQIDGGAWQPWYINSVSSDWQEVTQIMSGLSAGSHTLTVTYREGDTKLDWFEVGATNARTTVVSSKLSVLDGQSEVVLLPPLAVTTRLYPNPAQDQLTVNTTFPTSTPYTIHVVDLAGRTLWRQSYSGKSGSNEVAIDITSYPKGVYNLRLSTPQKVLTQKLLIR